MLSWRRSRPRATRPLLQSQRMLPTMSPQATTHQPPSLAGLRGFLPPRHLHPLLHQSLSQHRLRRGWGPSVLLRRPNNSLHLRHRPRNPAHFRGCLPPHQRLPLRRRRLSLRLVQGPPLGLAWVQLPSQHRRPASLRQPPRHRRRHHRRGSPLPRRQPPPMPKPGHRLFVVKRKRSAPSPPRGVPRQASPRPQTLSLRLPNGELQSAFCQVEHARARTHARPHL